MSGAPFFGVLDMCSLKRNRLYQWKFPIQFSLKSNKGETDIIQVLKDILAHTKLNYNACIFD